MPARVVQTENRVQVQRLSHHNATKQGKERINEKDTKINERYINTNTLHLAIKVWFGRLIVRRPFCEPFM